MEIQQAKEPDIVEALYIIKTAFDSKNLNKNYWRPPLPDYEKLSNELSAGLLFMIREMNISVGTLSFTNDEPETYKKIEWETDNDKSLFVKRIAIAPNWLNDKLKSHVSEFIDNYARENNFEAIKLNVYSTNEEMNSFYTELGFKLKNKTKTDDFETPFNYYEKVV
jgi:ribosomal protein S18 acetylase RimI-like enzyme